MQFTRTLAALMAVAASSLPLPANAGHSDAIIAGAAGFAVGTIFGSATAAPRYYAPAPVYVGPPVIYQPMPVYYYAPAPWSPEWYAYCARKYQSFDARSGTYLGFDGLLHLCL